MATARDSLRVTGDAVDRILERKTDAGGAYLGSGRVLRIAARRTATKPAPNAIRRISNRAGFDEGAGATDWSTEVGGGVWSGLPTMRNAVAALPGMPLSDVTAPVVAV
jgi:hypothetical protein